MRGGSVGCSRFQRLSYSVILDRDIVEHRSLGQLRLVQDRPEIKTVCLPVGLRPGGIEGLDVADRFIEGSET